MKDIIFCKCADKWGPAAPLLLRFAAGAVFIVHGWQKVTGLEQFGGFLASLGVPLPSFFAAVVMVVEFGGGIALVLGVLTHWVSKFLAIDMLVATLLFHLKNGFLVSDQGIEFTMTLFAVAVALMIMGPGKWSVDAMLMRKKKSAPVVAEEVPADE